MKKLLVACGLLLGVAANAQKITAEIITDRSRLPLDQYRSDRTTIDNVAYSYDWIGRSRFAFEKNVLKQDIGLSITATNAITQEKKEKPMADGNKVFLPISPLLKVINGKLYCFYFKPATDNDDFVLEMVEVNPATLETGAAKEIIRYKRQAVGSIMGGGALDYLNLTVELSPNGNYVGINTYYDKAKKLWFALYDKEFTLITKGETERMKNGNKIEAYDMVIRDNGSMYIPMMSVDGFDLKQDPRLLVIAKDKATSFVIEQPGLLFRSMKITPVSPTKLLITGTYKNEGADFVTGVYKATANLQTNTTEDLGYWPITDSLGEQLEKIKYGVSKRKEVGMSPIDVETTILSDGTCCIHGLFRRTLWVEAYTRFYFYAHMLVVYIKDGKASYNLVPRIREKSNIDEAGEYYAFPYKDKIILLYNDARSNLDLPTAEIKRSDNYKKHVLTAAVVERNGDIKRSLVLDDTDAGYLVMPRFPLKVNDNTIALPMWKPDSHGDFSKYVKWVKIMVE